jgi:hypothetical protein
LIVTQHHAPHYQFSRRRPASSSPYGSQVASLLSSTNK